MRRLILASGSPYRAEVLGQLGIPFEILPPDLEEIVDPRLSPPEVARDLARQKAAFVAALPQAKGALVIGSDQICLSPSGQILGKPQTFERAKAQLQALQGQVHQLITAVAISDGDQVVDAIDIHQMRLWPLTEDEIVRYLERDTPYDCAGSYRLESLGMALMEKIAADAETADATAIIGLPLMKTLGLLRRHFDWRPLDWPADSPELL